MGHAPVRPRTPEERLIWWAIVGTWGFWALGALYHVLPVLAWSLAGLALARRLKRGGGPIPAGVVVWCAAALALLAALVVGHVEFELDTAQLLKSIAGWGKGWALFAVLPFAGALLVIRPCLVWRAMAVLGAQSLAVGLAFALAAVAGLPGVLYVSPLIVAGGADASFFDVGPYLPDPGWVGFRLRFFAPWSPAAALAGAVIAALAAFDRDRRWAIAGMAAGAFMCLAAQSRLGLVAVLAIAVLVPTLSRLGRPEVWAAAAAAALVLGIGWEVIAEAADQALDAFTHARADSSRVRQALQAIAWHRWLSEAPLWGHGIVERGSHHVEFMAIGSHHTWYSLLFVKGLVGCAAFAAALAWTGVEMLARAQRDRAARSALAVVVVLVLFSFGENVEILAYLVWPALLLLGIVMRRPMAAPHGG